MTRLHYLSLHYALLLLWGLSLTTAAPTSCAFSCPDADQDGRGLITSTYATNYDGPYSIFDCVYAISGTPNPPHTCRYYKADGLNALGQTGSACPTQAVPCSAEHSPNFSAPEKIESPPWLGPGNDLLYWKEHHPGPTPP
ncbi:hypothetical protein FPV67DRAFT_299119 [Lyophyllum atratum]|nr:hypothetical protein FPV67DRAFT_299119 [Lyophyllum atratum]